MGEGNNNYPKSFKFDKETFKLLSLAEDIKKGKIAFYSYNYLASYALGVKCITIIPNGNADRVFLLEFNPVSDHFTTLEIKGIGTLYKVHNEDKYIEPEGIYKLIGNGENNKITITRNNKTLSIAFPIETIIEDEQVYFKTPQGNYKNFKGAEILTIGFTPEPQMQEPKQIRIVPDQVVRLVDSPKGIEI
jgi:hypothetical protein